MRQIAGFLLACVLVTAGGAAAQDRSAAQGVEPWPQANGPFGNFTAPRYGCELVDDLTQAKVAWTSEENELGYGKTSVSGFFGQRAKRPGTAGSANSIIAAEGKIFASSFLPRGDAYQEAVATPRQLEKYSPEEQAKIKRALSIDADDLTVAIDMETGKTVWRAIEKGKGYFRGMGKRGGWGVSPAYGDGKVFSLGTTGLLYAYDAKTGAKVWETNIGATHERWENEKKTSLENKSAPQSSAHVSLVVADDVLIVPLFDGGDMGLRGVDTKTGQTLWEVPQATAKTATPAVWRHEGKAYVLTATHGGGDFRNGKLRLIDPKDGKVLWTVEKLGNTHFSLAPSDKHVIVNVGSKEQEGEEHPYMLMGCYRLSSEGATLAWTMPDEPAFWHLPRYESSDWRKYLMREGKVYYYSRWRSPETQKMVQYFYILDEETGKVLHRHLGMQEGFQGITNCGYYLIEDRLLQLPDNAHGERFSMQLWTADPENLVSLGGQWQPFIGTTAYNVWMEFPYVDGRLYIRAEDGTVRRLDLRKERK